MADNTSVRFSTAALPLDERLSAYRDMLGRSVGHFTVEAIGDRFDFSSTSLALPGLGIAQIASSALRIERTRDMAADTTRDLVFAVVHEGSSSRMQRGRWSRAAERSCRRAMIGWRRSERRRA